MDYDATCSATADRSMHTGALVTCHCCCCCLCALCRVLQAATEVLAKALQTLHMKAEVRDCGGRQGARGEG
jgi:hypothetical protein